MMTKKRQAAVWVGLWGFWAALSRNNHPTLVLDGIATGLLLAAFASAVYLNWLVLVPRFWDARRFPAYWACLLATVGVLTLVVVAAIQKVYDILWGPDSRRYSFWVNFGLDLGGMAVHLLAAGAVVWLARRRRRGVPT